MDFPIQEWLWPNLNTMIISLATVLILFIIFKFFLFNKVRAMVEKRQNFIETEINNAKTQSETATKQNEEAILALENANLKANEIVTQSKVEAQKKYDEILAAASDDARKLAQDNQLAMIAEKESLKEEIRKEIIDVAFGAAKKVLETEVDSTKNAKLVDDFIKGMENEKL